MIRLILLAILFCTIMTACGQYGPLRLPEPTQEKHA